MARTRLALIGAGRIGRRHLDTIARAADAELVAIADPAEGAEALAAGYGTRHFADFEAMLEEAAPEGVVVATPTADHLAPALAALAAGAHLLIEKPITATLVEAQQIIAAARAAEREVLVGHHRRHYPFIHDAREIVRSGSLGRLAAVNGQWTLRKADSYFEVPGRRRRPAGPVLTNLIHEIDTLRYICGEIAAVSAELASLFRGHEKEETGALALRFENGALGTFLMSDAAASPWAWEYSIEENPEFPFVGRNTCRFVGSEGALEFPNLKVWRHEDSARGWNTPQSGEAIPIAVGDAYVRQCAHFCAVIRGEESPRITAEDATRTLAATLAVFEAAESGRRVEL